MWDATKARTRGKSITKITFILENKSSQMNDLSCCFKRIEKEEQLKPKASRRKEIIKVKMEINKIEKQYRKINKTKSSLRRSIKLIFQKRERRPTTLWLHWCILPKSIIQKCFQKIERKCKPILGLGRRGKGGTHKGHNPFVGRGGYMFTIFFFFWKG